MDTSAPPNPYAHHRFPAEIISHGVWLYFRFCLSHFRPRRHRLPTPAYRQAMAQRFQIWQEIMGTAMAASGQGKV